MVILVGVLGITLLVGVVGLCIDTGSRLAVSSVATSLFGLAITAAATSFRSTALVAGPQSLGDALGRELERGRRYGHSLAIIRLDAVTRKDRASIVEYLSVHARLTDVTRLEHDSVYLILSESGLDAVPVVLRRLGASEVGGFITGTAAVAFPGDGVTAGELLSKLTARSLSGAQG